MQLSARIISWVFLPLFVPMYVLLMTFYIPSNQDYYSNQDCLYTMYPANKLVLLYFFGTLGTLMPALSYLIMFRSGFISTVEMDDRRERTFPILIMFFYCMALYVMFWLKFSEMELPKFIYGLPLSGAVVTALFVVINRWTKISIHSGAMGIASGYLIAYMVQHAEYAFWMLPVAIVASGAVMSARVYLGKHTMFEVVAGWVTGTLITFAINYFY